MITLIIKLIDALIKLTFSPIIILIGIFSPSKKQNKQYIYINNIKLTKEQLSLLKQYGIDYKVKNVHQLLDNIYGESCYCYDDKGIPIPMYEEDCDILDDLYDDIKRQN